MSRTDDEPRKANDMRVSNAQTSAAMHANMNRKSEDMAKVQAQIASGLRLERPSDDPIASARLLRIQREQASLSQYNENIDRVKGDLSIQEVHLSSSADVLSSMRDLLLWASNESNSGEDLAAIANQLSSLEQTAANCFNVKDEAGNYLFSGTKIDVPAVRFDDTTGRYVMNGNSKVRQTMVGNGVLIDENVTAKAMLGENAEVLNKLHELVVSLKDAPRASATKQQLKDTLDLLEVAHGNVLEAITDLGGRQNMLELMKDSNDDVNLVHEKTKDDLKNLDMGQAVLQLRGYEVSMQASQKVYSRLASISLFELI
ncbi:Flagellar hook-associated protein 3 [compost metagenome]